jgi:hypothetical protein
MNGGSAAVQSGNGNALLAIGTGGLIAGALDLTQACVLFSARIPLAIAAGLLGPKAFQGGSGTYVLGVLLHFFIAFSTAAVYYAASRKLKFLTEYALICGLFFGIAGTFHAPYRFAPVRASRKGTLSVSRFSTRLGGAHGAGRAADFL